MKNIILIALFVYIINVSIKIEEEKRINSIKFIGNEWKNNKFQTCDVIEEDNSQQHRILTNENKFNSVIVDRFPQFITHDEKITMKSEIVEIFGMDKARVNLKLKEICNEIHILGKPESKKNDEVSEILLTGPVNNRIAVV
jgi:hypothetical protein